MTKKEMEMEIKAINKIVSFLMESSQDKLTVSQAKKRSYIVRYKYIGKITHKKIKEDFKKEIEAKLLDTFDSVTNNILNYEFYFEGINRLNEFYDILKKYEKKQIVMDTYGGTNEK